MPDLIPDISLGAALTEEQAQSIFALGKATVVFALLAQSKMLAEQRAAEAARKSRGKKWGIRDAGEKYPCV